MDVVYKIAWRFLTHNKGQSVLIVLGMAIGVAVQIFIGLLIGTVQDSISDTTVGSIPHITIESNTADELISDPDAVAQKMGTIAGVNTVEVVAQEAAFVEGPENNLAVIFRGLEPDSQDLFQIRKNIVSGRYFESEREVNIGVELLEELEIALGDSIVLNNKGDKKVYKVVGVFEQGITAVDKGLVVGHIKTVRQFFGLRQKATSVDLQVDDLLLTNLYVRQVSSVLGNDALYDISDWQKENELLTNALSSQNTSVVIIQAAVLASLAVAITSVLSITVMQKAKQIGILKAMGLSDRKTSYIFLASSFLVGVIGAFAGMLLGFVMYFAFVTNNLDPDGNQIFKPSINWAYVAISWCIAVGISTLAGIVPARRAVQLDPIEIIQNA